MRRKAYRGDGNSDGRRSKMTVMKMREWGRRTRMRGGERRIVRSQWGADSGIWIGGVGRGGGRRGLAGWRGAP